MDKDLYASLGLLMDGAVLEKLRSEDIKVSSTFLRRNFVALSLLEQRNRLHHLLGDIPLANPMLQADIKSNPDYTRLIKVLRDELAHIDQLMGQLEQKVSGLKNPD